MKLDLQIGRPNKWDPTMFGTRDPGEVEWEYIQDTERAVQVINTLGKVPFALDTETEYIPGVVDPLTAKMRVMSIATENSFGNDVAYVFDVLHMDKAALAAAFRERAKTLGVKRLVATGFNANFDDPVTTLNLEGQQLDRRESYKPLLDWIDLFFAASLIRLGAPGAGYPSLADTVKRNLGIDMEGKGSTQLSYDMVSELSYDQISYAAQDAVVTLWLADALRETIATLGLGHVLTLECRSRPFLQAMTINGLGFQEKEWMEKLDELIAEDEQVLAKIAELTGGQPSLFGPPKPTFSPDSPDDLKRALNEHAPELVAEYFNHRGHRGRPATFQPYDSADKTTLGLMRVYGEAAGLDTTLIQLLEQHSKLSKMKSTYGENMMKLLDQNGRFHSEFTQCVTATGRTSSQSPNAQNFSPRMKPYFKPAPRIDENGVAHERVLIQGDYSQAELRVSAQLTGETVRREAFANSEDQHAVVAGRMFNVNMEELMKSEEGQKRYKQFRNKAKPINFGLGYGMKAQLLADTLTMQGIITTKAQADDLIDNFFKALPQEADWLHKRDKFVENLATDVKLGLEKGVPVDFKESFLLLEVQEILKKSRRHFKQENVDNPTYTDMAILELSMKVYPDEATRSRSVANLAERLQWADGYLAPVLIRKDGTPWEFFSKTIAGRRRIFQVRTKDVIEDLAIKLAAPKTSMAAQLVDRWAEDHGVELASNPYRFHPETREVLPHHGRRNGYSFGVLRKKFEHMQKNYRGKANAKQDFVEAMLIELAKMPHIAPSPMSPVMGMDEMMLRDAAASQINRMANAYRNAPIQGSVADAVLHAFAELFDLFDDYPTVMPVTTVHDSIVVECDKEQALEVAQAMKQRMEEALAYYVPDVKVVSDIEIMSSLDSSDILTDEDLAA